MAIPYDRYNFRGVAPQWSYNAVNIKSKRKIKQKCLLAEFEDCAIDCEQAPHSYNTALCSQLLLASKAKAPAVSYLPIVVT